MNGWLKLDPQRLDKPNGRNVPKEGVHIEVHMSPYDIPDAVRGEYNKYTNRFVIEFRYIGEEPWRAQTIAEHVVARIGKNSGRIYGLEVNVDALKASSVEFALLPAITEGIDRLARTSTNKSILSDRYRIAKEAIQEAEELLPDVHRLTSLKAAAK